MIDIDGEKPTGTAAGSCYRCGHWSPENRIVREIHSDSGAGATIVECAGPHRNPVRQPADADRARTYPL